MPLFTRMFFDMFRFQDNFEASASVAVDAIAARDMAVDGLSSEYSPQETLAVLYQRDETGHQRCKTVKGGGEATWPPNLEAVFIAGKLPLNSFKKAPAGAHMELGASREAHALTRQMLCDPFQATHVIELKGEDSQCMIDFLDTALRESGGLRTNEGKFFLKLLRGLSKSAQVFPQRYKLKNLQCDFSQPREGGGFADIFEGKYGNQKLCLKAMRVFGVQENAQTLRAQMKELILWAHLSHPNLLPFYGVYGHDGRSQRRCIVAPWMHNGNLSGYLVAFPHSPRMALVSDITAGLAYLHQMEVVHGDLKAKNVLISDNGRALLADFGISRLMSSAQLASTRLSNGTMRWMAPELLIDHSSKFLPSFESDIWSFGCLCYEVFTRTVPFYQHSSEVQLILAILGQEIPIRPEENQLDSIDDHMWDLMKRCWNYDPHNRPYCDEIRQFIADIISLDDQDQVPLPLDPESLPPWPTIKNKSEVMVDYDHVNHILLDILQIPHSVGALGPVVKLKHTHSSSVGLLVATAPEELSASRNLFGRVLQSFRDGYAFICQELSKAIVRKEFRE